MNATVKTYKDATGAIILLLVIQLLMAIKAGVFNGQLGDTDVYMWLSRVLHLYETGAWYDHVLPGVNPPVGYEQHWTRPFDVLLLAGAWLGSAFTDFGNALYVWSAMISPVLEILALLVFFRAVIPLYEKPENEILGLLFITQMGVITSFVAGRADHQSLIILLFIASLGLGLRMLVGPFDRLVCFVAGLISALSIWVSVESILFPLVILAGLGIYWLLGEKGISRKLLHYSVSLFVLLIVFRVTEYGWSRFTEPAFDQISIAYIALFGLIAAFWAIVHRLEIQSAGTGSLTGRLGIAVIGVLVTAMLMYRIYPGFFSGPMGNVDELFRRVHLVKIKELQPVLSLNDLMSDNWLQSLTRFILWLGIIVPGIPVLIYLYRKHNGTARKAWSYIIICTLVYLPLSLKEIRWVPYIAILMLPGYAWLVATAMRSISDRFQGGAAGLLRITVLVSSVIVFALPRVIFSEEDKESETKACPLMPISSYLDESAPWGEAAMQLLAFTDFGPELLYRTRHSVYSIPSHRYHSGFTDSYNIMSAPDDDQALQIIRKRNIDLILVCPGGHEDHFYASKAGDEIFHQRISAGNAPEWLAEVTLPPDIAESFRLYRVATPSPVEVSTRSQ